MGGPNLSEHHLQYDKGIKLAGRNSTWNMGQTLPNKQFYLLEIFERLISGCSFRYPFLRPCSFWIDSDGQDRKKINMLRLGESPWWSAWFFLFCLLCLWLCLFVCCAPGLCFQMLHGKLWGMVVPSLRWRPRLRNGLVRKFWSQPVAGCHSIALAKVTPLKRRDNFLARCSKVNANFNSETLLHWNCFFMLANQIACREAAHIALHLASKFWCTHICQFCKARFPSNTRV